MNVLKTVCVTAVAASSLAFLATQAAIGRDGNSTAKSLFETKSTQVERNSCPSKASDRPTGHDLLTRRSGTTNVTLQMNVVAGGNPPGQDPMCGSWARVD
jgi:hypothetical protein